MTPRIKIIIASFTFLVMVLGCSTLLGGYLPETPHPEVPATQEATTEPVFEEPPSCPIITDQIIALAVSGGEDVEENLLDSEITLVTYSISGDELIDPYYENVSSDLQDEQNNVEIHQQVWDYFRALVPANEREGIGEYSIITDGQGGH